MNNCNKQKTIWGLGKLLPTSGFFSGELSPCALDITHGVRVAGHHQEVVESCTNVLFTPFFFFKAVNSDRNLKKISHIFLKAPIFLGNFLEVYLGSP